MRVLRASRPYMPGYGVRPADAGTGLLPWQWAEDRLSRSLHYWVATATPQPVPHLSPVWGVWDGTHLWFSCSNESRKARNLGKNGQCAISTDDPLEPVIVEGTVDRTLDHDSIATYAQRVDEKYSTDYASEFYDPVHNSVFRVSLQRVFGLSTADFDGSPTRWTFSDA